MKPIDAYNILLIDKTVSDGRIASVRKGMAASGIDGALVSDNANIFYLTGRVFTGYVYIPAEGEVIYFVRRPVTLKGDGVVKIRKAEEMAQTLGLNIPQRLGLELDVTPYSAVERLCKVFEGAELMNLSPAMRCARAVKDDAALDMLRLSGKKQVFVYEKIPRLYTEGMTDVELQIEIERASRLEGCLGQFRISGDSMELYMGNVLAGENADTPTPYDFAMGGEGANPSLPVGANGTPLREGMTVMVDVNGDYTGYMTDMTRVYCVGPVVDIEPLAMKAHECSRRIHAELVKMLTPGTEAKSLWERAQEIVKEDNLEEYFMGHRQKAGFIGHGVGIEINELPVISPRSRDVIQAGNVIALEPKFVIPHVGAVGIESTYAVHADKVENLTPAREDIISLD